MRMPGIYAGDAGSKKHLLSVANNGKRQPAMSYLTVSLISGDQHHQFYKSDWIQSFFVV